ncbi:DUF421 domain-containing protein [Paenibacillus lentus]|uniref:DUF421 domain-containing protein n=1 Tax=Paenibacillus lentus TaxID=1338368 RepID=A0A3S8RXL5_9BACL|nr:DUF421 domain-containing protein [Paenibacillus lentus]AZK47477.1 DUF421 domain-containing protein [Paenibacillus lentus]
MDFFQSNESLTVLEWILRALLSFAFLLVVTKFMGQRSISQLRLLDFIIALVLGNIIAHPLSDEKVGMKGSFVTALVLTMLYVSATWLSLKWPKLKRFLHPKPITLIHKGRIQYDQLTKARISIEYLFSELRKEKVEDIQKVALALWEPGGIVSVFMDTPHQPVTPSDLNLRTEPLTLTRPIIVEGNVDMTLLKEMGKDVEWLQDQIRLSNSNIRDVILATVSYGGHVKVFSGKQLG